MTPISNIRLRYALNPAFEPAYGQRQLDVLGGQATSAEAQIRSWPGYQPTPRAICPAWRGPSAWPASAADEGGRFGLGSFKALGGARSAGGCARAGWAGTTCPWRICCPAAIAN